MRYQHVLPFDAVYDDDLRHAHQSTYTILKRGVVVPFLVFVLGIAALSVFASSKTHHSQPRGGMDDSSLLLISLDGFRYDYIDKGCTPTLETLSKNGIMAEYLEPLFPSITFPNHYGIATGLYAESHGIIANQFLDPDTHETFMFTNASTTKDKKWWLGEPIWVTAELQNKKSAVCMWPGSDTEIHGKLPSIHYAYNASMTPTEKSISVLSWLDLPRDKRPQFMAVYYPEADIAGHREGPDSALVEDALKTIDTAIKVLVGGLKERNLLNSINIMIVSDHGMLGIERNRTVPYYQFLDFESVEIIDHRPLLFIYPKIEADTNAIYARMKEASENLGTFHVYLRESIPKEFHYSKNIRIPPIFAYPNPGYFFIDKEPLGWGFLAGIHGYDPKRSIEMNGLFIGHGPVFSKSKKRVPYFKNVELYHVMCKILGVQPAPNNSTQAARNMLSSWLNIEL